MRNRTDRSPFRPAILIGLAAVTALLAGSALAWVPLGLGLEILLGACYVVLAGWIGFLAVDLRREAAIPTDFLKDVTDAIHRGQRKTAYYLARTHNAALARVLAAGMARLPYGLDSAQEAALRMALTLKAEKEKRLVYLEIIGTLGPALGASAGFQTLLQVLV